MKNLFESLGIEANHHLVTNDDGGSRTALILLYQLTDGGIVAGNIAHFEVDSSPREEGLGNPARRSTWLAEDDDFVFLHCGNEATSCRRSALGPEPS